jgi:glucan phosphoethanolaminetransferase (alkaline phosphatase superfamily)
VPLDAIAGPGTTLVFTTRFVPKPGADPSKLVALPLWGAPEILAPSDDDRLAVVLISFDTLRADHVGAYGSALPTTPNLDRLAAEGVVFDDVFSAFPSTTASHMTMLTGRYPASHGVMFLSQSLGDACRPSPTSSRGRAGAPAP